MDEFVIVAIQVKAKATYLFFPVSWNFYYYYLMCAFSLYFHKYLARFRQNISFWRLDDKTFKCPALYLPVTDF